MIIKVTHKYNTCYTVYVSYSSLYEVGQILVFCFQKPPEQERKSSMKKKKEDGILAALKIEASKVKRLASISDFEFIFLSLIQSAKFLLSKSCKN